MISKITKEYIIGSYLIFSMVMLISLTGGFIFSMKVLIYRASNFFSYDTLILGNVFYLFLFTVYIQYRLILLYWEQQDKINNIKRERKMEE